MNTHHPILFVPHGSPMMALRPGAAGNMLSRLGPQLKTPRAIVIISPHWLTPQVTVGTATQLDTIHDFYGFDRALYELNYPATGCPEAAQAVIAALTQAGLPVSEDPQRGLDHGAWIPLRQMFPDADIPVIPVSVQPHLGTTHAWRVGEALGALTEQGFLIIGSGNVTHNLGDWRGFDDPDAPVPEYVERFSEWVFQAITHEDKSSLLNYRQLNADGVRAHPTDEHLLPLFVALGAAGEKAQAQAFFRGVSDHVISMDGYQFHRKTFHA